MKNVYTKVLFSCFFIICAVLAFAQPAKLGTDITGSYALANLTTRGGASFVRLQAAAAASYKYEFVDAAATYSTNWRPYNGTNAAVGNWPGFDVRIDPSVSVSSARYNTSFGGATGFMATATSGNYYTFNIGTNSAANNFMSVLSTAYNPRTFASSTLDPFYTTYGVIGVNQTFKPTVTLSGTLQTTEFLICRYSTDFFVSSLFLQCTVTFGSTYTCTIPAQLPGTTVQYYFMTSNKAYNDAAMTHANADYLTLNNYTASGQNVGGTNFSYVQDANSYTIQSGTWATGATWASGAEPGAGNIPVILPGHSVYLSNASRPSSGGFKKLSIRTGAVLYRQSTSTSTLTFDGIYNPDTTLVIKGDFRHGNQIQIDFTSSASANSAHSISGSDTLSVVGIRHQNAPTYSSSLDFGTGTVVVRNAFFISTGGYVTGNAPYYDVNSNLQYNATTYTVAAEWTTGSQSGRGVPYNVVMGGQGQGFYPVNTGWTALGCPFVGQNYSSINFGASTTYRQLLGSLIEFANGGSKVTYSTGVGGDLYIAGDMFNQSGVAAGGWVFNTRGTRFNGTGVQKITSNNGNIFFSYVTIDKPSKYVWAGNGIAFTAPNGSGSPGNAAANTALTFAQDSSKFAMANAFVGLYGKVAYAGSTGLGSGFVGDSSASTQFRISDNNVNNAPFLNTNDAYGNVRTGNTQNSDLGQIRFVPGKEFVYTFEFDKQGGTSAQATLGTNLYVKGNMNLYNGTLYTSPSAPVRLWIGGQLIKNQTAGYTLYNQAIDLTGGGLKHILKFTNAGNVVSTAGIASGLPTITVGSASEPGNEVWYSAASGTQNLIATNYNKLVLANPGYKATTGAFSVLRRVNVLSSDTISVGHVITMAANTRFNLASTACYKATTSAIQFSSMVRDSIILATGSVYNAAGTGGVISTEPIYRNVWFTGGAANAAGNDSIGVALGASNITTMMINGYLDCKHHNTGNANLWIKIPNGRTIDIAGDLRTSVLNGGSFNFADSVSNSYGSGTLKIGGNSNTFQGRFSLRNGLVEYTGTGAQTIRAGAYYSLKMSGGGTKIVSGSGLLLSVQTNLNLTSGQLYLGTNELAITGGSASATTVPITAGSPFSATNCIVTNDSGYVRVYKNLTRFKYDIPLGTGTAYTPVRINQWSALSGNSATSYLSFRSTPIPTPSRLSVNTLNSHWRVLSTGYTNSSPAPNLTFFYEDGQVTGTEANYQGSMYTNTYIRKGLPVNITQDSIFAKSTDTLQTHSLISGARFSAGEPNAFQTIAIVYYYSRGSGVWSSPSTWSNVALGGTAAATAPPNTASNIVVGNSNTVTLDVATVSSIATLDIQSAGKLDLGTNSQSGLSIGTFTMSTGSGTLALGPTSGTAVFPTVSTNSFLGSTNSTLEWNGSGSYILPTSPSAVYNLAFSGSGTKTFGSSITINGNYTTSGTVTVDQANFTGNRSGAGGTLTLGSGTTVRVANRFPQNFNTWVTTGSTVDYYGTVPGNNLIDPGQYHNLIISGNKGGSNISLGNNNYPSSYIAVAGAFTPTATNYTNVSSTNNNGDFVFNGTGSQTVPPFNYCLSVHVLTRSSGTVTFSNTADGTGNTNIQCNTNGYGFDFAALTGTGTYDFSASTLEMMGAFNGTHTFRSTPTGANYNNLIVNKASGYTPAYSVSTNTLRINGTLSVLNGPDFDVSAGQLTMGTGSAIALTSGRILKSSAGNGITLNNCNITIGTGSTWETGYGTVAITTTGSLTLNGTGRMGNYNPTTNNSDVTLGSLNVPTGATAGLSPAILVVNGATQITGALTLAGTTQDKTFAGNFTLDGSFTNTVTGSTLFGGNFTINNGSTFTQGSSAYAFSGTGKTIGGTIATALSFSNASVSGTVTNNLTNGLTFTSNLGGIGTLTQGTNSILTLQGNCTPTISGAASGNIVNVSGASAQTIPTGSFQNLVLSGGNKSASDTVRIIGQLTLSSGLGTVAPTNRYVRMLNGSTLIKNGGNWTSNAPKVWNNEQYNLTVSTATTPGMEFGLLAENPINNLSITAASPVLLPVSVNASGTLNIATGSVLGINGKTLYLKTGISGAGTISGSSTSNLDFYGTGAYGTIPFTSGAAELNRLKVNRTSTGSVTLGTDVQVDSGAVLVNGTLNTGANKVVLLPAAMLSEVDNASQLLGTVQVTRTIGVTNFININGIGMQLSANSSMGSTVISRVTGTALNGNAPNTPCCGMNTSLKRYYDITPTNNSNLGVFLKLNYLTQELNGQPEVAFAMYKASLPYNNSNPGWSQIRAIYNAGAKQVSNVVAIQSFSRFTLSSEFAGPLPVTLSSFSARLQGKDASIKWATLSEEGVKFFNVERSSDGKTYSQIVSKPAIGSVNSETDYTTVDQGVTGLAAAELYYRLRVINMDGSQTVSDPVSINLRKTAGTGGVSLFPNPTADGSSVLKISTSDASVRIVISDISGKAVSTVDQPLASGSLELPLALPANAPAGSYMVSVQGETLHKNLILVYRK